MSCSEEWRMMVAMVAVNFALAVVNILLKKVLSQGMSHLLIITYRQSISAILLIPFSYLLERKKRPKLTAHILCHLFLSALLGATLTQYFFLVGLQYTSATFTCAFVNMVPVNTFIMGLLLRIERVDMRKASGRAKVFGALISVGGSLVLTLYQGTPLKIQPTTKPSLPAPIDPATRQYENTRKGWATGSVFLTGGSLMWSSWFLVQARIGKGYPFQYSSTALMSLFGAIQSAILCLVIDRNINISAWIVKGKLEILTVIYAGMVGSGICYVVMSWCIKQRGPVFTAAFSPLLQILVAIFEVLVLHEQIRLGSVLGSILVVAGMYVLLWGKSKESANSPANKNAQTTEKECEFDQVIIPTSMDPCRP